MILSSSTCAVRLALSFEGQPCCRFSAVSNATSLSQLRVPYPFRAICTTRHSERSLRSEELFSIARFSCDESLF